jgi:tetratricopeptide (TPR) repeat protein
VRLLGPALLVLFAAPRLPLAPGRLAPSLAENGGGPAVRGADLTDIETCGACHEDVVAQWRSSAHAAASFNNPIYRVSVDRFRTDQGAEASRFCAGCHDPALLFDGSISQDIAPEDARAHAGITCRTCHGIEETRPDGNGSYRLTGTDIPLPADGDPKSLERHLARVALAPLRTPELCGTCHKAFLGPATGNPSHLPGMDDFTPWAQSAYGGSAAERIDPLVAPQECIACHMPRERAVRGDVAAKNGTVASHRFLGGHSWLSAMARDTATERRAQAFLRGTVSVDFGAATLEDGRHWLPADGAELGAGQALTLDVVVRNQSVGHRFPGGTGDAQDAWLEVEVRDATGALLAASLDDADAHRFRSLAIDERGEPVLERQTHAFRAFAFNQTLGPREATVVRYVLDAKDWAGAAQPLHALARVRHRSRNLELQRAACESSRTERGKRFAAASRRWTGRAFDACTAQPVTELAHAQTWLGRNAASHLAPGDREKWVRLYEHGLGMSRAVQEQLDEARQSLRAAIEALGPEGARVDRAMVMCALAQVSGRQGRVEEALDWTHQAQVFAPGHPALWRAQGAAYASVWRWTESLVPLRLTAWLSPSDSSSWKDLALAQGSAGDDAASLESAQQGLTLQPRDADLLRLQAQALDALGASEASRATESYLTFRPADEAPGLKALCSSKVPGCALERTPVHTHVLKPAR